MNEQASAEHFSDLKTSYSFSLLLFLAHTQKYSLPVIIYIQFFAYIAMNILLSFSPQVTPLPCEQKSETQNQNFKEP